ncbi:MAG: hypothetical protein ACREAQ_04690 [Nitrososphaera sp.]
MSLEIALIAGSSVAGAVSAAVLDRLARARYDVNKKALHKPSVSSVRAELVSLLFEKTLASEAITRVYEASQEGSIDRLERDRLLIKYKQQLDVLNQKIVQLQPTADFADLTEMRNDLAAILEDKIGALDKKLQQLSRSGFTSAEDSRVEKIIAETMQVRAAPVEQKPKSEEKSIEQLQNEIVEALDRLEQVEIDKD